MCDHCKITVKDYFNKKDTIKLISDFVFFIWSYLPSYLYAYFPLLIFVLG